MPSAFKGDSRFTRRYDEEARIDSPDSDELSDTSDVPRSLKRTRREWLSQNYDEVVELYESYLTSGRAIFGGAFHQCGTISEFANFMFKFMQPGAT